MNVHAYKEGESAWYESVGFIANPYPIQQQEERFKSWSQGWWSVENKMRDDDHQKYLKELAAEREQDRIEKEIKEKKKSKKGRAELAGQSTLF